MAITIKIDSRDQKSLGFNYAQEQERTLRQALGNELYELLNRITKPLNYKAWWDGKE